VKRLLPSLGFAAAFALGACAEHDLVSMMSTSRDQGAHSALLVNGSQVVIYDPAGSYKHPSTPERGDLHYGITPVMEEVFKRFHARDSHYVQEQKLFVDRAMADAVIARIETQGPSPKMFCAISIADVLNDFDKFGDVPRSFFPGALTKSFAAMPGVQTTYTRESDVGKTIDLRLIRPKPVTPQS